MHLRVFQLPVALFLLAVAGSAQTIATNSPTQYVRSVSIWPISTSRQGLPVEGREKSWAILNRLMATPLTSAALVKAIDNAHQEIDRAYSSLGKSVRIDHETLVLSSRMVSIRFQVIELCDH